MSGKIKFENELYDRMKKCAEAAGYSSVDEFARHVLEREVAKLLQEKADEETAKRLKGLGYLS
ncbi:MAG TPA: hypothetical protein PL033_16920 [Candidatus Brocadiia bacterium]|nr:hypothetical protein [Candidatus Brocadiia bacterium]